MGDGQAIIDGEIKYIPVSDGKDLKDLGQIVDAKELERFAPKVEFRRVNEGSAISIVQVDDIDGGRITIPFFEGGGAVGENFGELDDKTENVFMIMIKYGLPMMLATRIVYDRTNFLERLDKVEVKPRYLMAIRGKPGAGKSAMLAIVKERKKYARLDVWNMDMYTTRGMGTYQNTIEGLSDNQKMLDKIKAERDTMPKGGGERKQVPLGMQLDGMIEAIISGELSNEVILLDLPANDQEHARHVIDLVFQSVDAVANLDQSKFTDFSDKVNACVVDALNGRKIDAQNHRNYVMALMASKLI